jgi:hypothetical protein
MYASLTCAWLVNPVILSDTCHVTEAEVGVPTTSSFGPPFCAAWMRHAADCTTTSLPAPLPAGVTQSLTIPPQPQQEGAHQVQGRAVAALHVTQREQRNSAHVS